VIPAAGCDAWFDANAAAILEYSVRVCKLASPCAVRAIMAGLGSVVWHVMTLLREISPSSWAALMGPLSSDIAETQDEKELDSTMAA
jgi:hypothetical protein